MAPKPNPFTSEQEKQIVFQFGKLGSASKVRRWFWRHYEHKNSRTLPSLKQFHRVIERFKSSGSTSYSKSPGRPQVSDENVDRVNELISDDKTLSIRMISTLVALSIGVVWKILRKKLKLYPYKPHNVIPLNEVHKQNHVNFCKWLVDQPERFPNLIFFSDEKTFEERTRPNRQNERYWSNVDPQIEDENRVQGGRKVMVWGGLIDGRVILHWFDEGERENQHVYLQMLQYVVCGGVDSVRT